VFVRVPVRKGFEMWVSVLSFVPAGASLVFCVVAASLKSTPAKHSRKCHVVDTFGELS
jgi:hypothetical protein